MMPFTDEFDKLYRAICKIVEQSGFKCVRADDFYNSNLILTDITNSIRRCFAAIAEVTTNNPNVFYEIGFAHAIGKKPILIRNKVENKIMPFDISGFRALFFEDTIGGGHVFEQELTKFLRELK